MDEMHHSQTEYQLPSIVKHAQSPVEVARQAIASEPANRKLDCSRHRGISSWCGNFQRAKG